MKKKVLVLIIFLAVFFRFNNLNWDSNQHLHPDERFLTMVGGSLKLPKNILDYFNPQKSTMNPANVGYSFFVYGTFPLTLNKILAIVFGNDNYDAFVLQGRFLSAFFDLMTLFVVYKITELLVKKNSRWRKTNLPLWSAFFYAIAVYPIQSSHFFTTDSFAVFFSLLALYFALKTDLVFSAFSFGLAMACKVSSVYLLPLILVFVIWPLFKKKDWLKILFSFGIFGLISLFSLFVCDPKFFSPGFFKSLRELNLLSSRNVWYPPLVQWFSKVPVLFSLFNLVFIGLGLPYFILVVVGIIDIISKLKTQSSKPNLKTKNYLLFIILTWVIIFFLCQSLQLVQSIRYLYILFPFLAIFAAVGVEKLINYALQITDFQIIHRLLFVIFILILLVWPILFSTIYFHKHTRVEASEWIYSNLEDKSLILGEYWDDALPLRVKENYGKSFQVELLPVFNPDTEDKWEKMNSLLAKADYYILSSNRGWGSISTVPERYPKMAKFYQDLLAGKNPNYRLIKTFEPYYYRFIRLPSSWVEETFTVYDHPTVMIFKFKKTKSG